MHHAKGIYFINADKKHPTLPQQIWTQGEPNHASNWFPTIDAPNQKSTQEIYITVDSSFTTISNGLLLDQTYHTDGTRTDYWKQALPHAPYLFMLGVGNYYKHTEWFDSLEVSYYTEPQYADQVEHVFGKTQEMIKFFSERLGVAYPWEKYSQIIVRNFARLGAMENTSASIFYEELLADKNTLVNRDFEPIIAHELAHQWFGNLVTCESWNHIALNESLATYSEYLWFEHSKGKEYADYHLFKDTRKYFKESDQKQVSIVRTQYENPEELFDRHTYEKGAIVLHMLRAYIGDEPFFKGLKIYLQKFQFGTAELSDLRKCFEKSSGFDLVWFFDQWFHTPGHPILDLEYTLTDAILSINFNQKHSIDNTDYTFTLPIQFQFNYEDTTLIYTHFFSDEQQVTQLKVRPNPKSYFVKNASIWLSMKELKTYSEQKLYQQFYEGDFYSKLNALRQIKQHKGEATSVLYIKAMENPVDYLRQYAVDYFDYDWNEKKGDLLVNLIKYKLEHDSSPKVRAACLNKLVQLEDEQVEYFAWKALYDSSNYVASVAIGILNKMNKNVLDRLPQHYFESVDKALSLRIAKLLAVEFEPNYNSFFEYQIWTNNRNSHLIAKEYGKYLIRGSKSLIEEGIKTLERYIEVERNDHKKKTVLKVMDKLQSDLVQTRGYELDYLVDHIQKLHELHTN